MLKHLTINNYLRVGAIKLARVEASLASAIRRSPLQLSDCPSPRHPSAHH